MSGKVNFKAYLMFDGSTEPYEVRRFEVDVDVAASFVYLEKKIQCIFPTISKKHFVITWIDMEGDQIAVSSDDELQTALTETQNCKLRKLYILVHSDDENDFYQQSQELEGEIHANIVCDGCNRDVRGFRYKCIECADFDLCSECEVKGLHPQHFMLRIAAPQQWYSHGKRLAHHLKKFVKKSTVHAYREDAARECPMGRRRHGRSKPNYDGHSWINVFADYINDWTNYTDECPKKRGVTKPPEQATEAKATTTEMPSQEKRKEAQPHVDFLKVVEDNIAQILNPFGIDISVQMKNDKQPESTTFNLFKNQPNATAKQTEPQTSSNVDEKKESEEEKIEVNVEHTQSTNPTTTNQEKSNYGKVSDDDEWTMIDTSKSMATTPDNVTSVTSAPTSTITDPISIPASTPSTSYSIVTPTITPLNKSDSNEDIVPSAPIQIDNSKKPMYPSLPKDEPTFYHPNPKIQHAVETMMQMGFTNEGGWLTQLLIAKNGDIDRALDILQPVKR